MFENHPSHPIPSHISTPNPSQDAYPEREKELCSGLRTRGGGDEGRNVGGVKGGGGTGGWIWGGREDRVEFGWVGELGGACIRG